jgi:hypothetical protein
MYSYRAEASSMRGVSIALSDGTSDDTITAVWINASVANLALAASTTLATSSLLDLKVATIDANVYALEVASLADTVSATNSRADQTGDALDGGLLLRSKLTMVELAQQDETDPLSVVDLNGLIYVTLAATYPFNTSFDDFKRVFACGAQSDGNEIDLQCPLSDLTHTCDLTSYGGGGAYFFDFVCPFVVPTCLYWDPVQLAFSSEGCSVVAGYSSDAVTCACNHLTTFVLSGNLTEPFFEAHTTPAPTASPTHAPSPKPSRSPTPHPTSAPTHKPTGKPSRFDIHFSLSYYFCIFLFHF